MLENILTLLMLVLLQAVLGFDNLLYISLESKKADVTRQSFVRKTGIGLAIIFRIILLFTLVKLIDYMLKDIRKRLISAHILFWIQVNLCFMVVEKCQN